MNCEFKRKLPIPMEVKEMYPVTSRMQEVYEKILEKYKEKATRAYILILLKMSYCTKTTV